VTSNLHVSTVRPASITVSHDFTVHGHSSPPFGSNYQCFDSKLKLIQWILSPVPVEGKPHIKKNIRFQIFLLVCGHRYRICFHYAFNFIYTERFLFQI